MDKQDLADLALVVLSAVAKAASLPVANTAITVIRALLASWEGAAGGAITPERAREDMQLLLAAIQSTDARTDAALTEKFKT